MITAGFGGWLGGRRSQKELKAQHQFERTKALTEHGRDKIGGAISALRFLHRHNQEAADGDLLAPDAEGNEIGKRYDLLAEAIPYIAEARTRKDVELVHSIIGDAWIMERYSNAGSAPWVVPEQPKRRPKPPLMAWGAACLVLRCQARVGASSAGPRP
ncbi:hypothetical protein [Amycolatopsis sp. cmx-11-51]|uniref:hypothetical protein n=1 Tax=Amycolatopsis sp. cmx-11-51 TaxID=2785797 RepID=UPI0039E4FCA6